MSEIKQCPYCGEEILATAQKCKHCGEWLTEDTFQKNVEVNRHSVVQSPTQKERIDKLQTPISEYAILLYWLGLIAVFIYLAHDLGTEDWNLPRRWRALLYWATYVPEWVCLFLETAVECIFLYGLLTGLKRHSKPIEKPLIGLIVLSGLGAICSPFADFDNMDEESGILLGFVLMPIMLSYIILECVIGIQLLVHYKGVLAKVGSFMLCSIVVTLFSIFLEEGSEIAIIWTIVSFGITYLYYKTFYQLFDQEE